MNPAPKRTPRELTKELTPAPRRRRSEDERIEALRRRIAELEARRARKAAAHDPVLREAHKLLRAIERAEKLFATNGRHDLANSAKAAKISLRGHLAETPATRGAH